MKLIYTQSKRKYDYYIIRFDYDKDIVDSVKKIPGAQYSPSYKEWRVRVSVQSSKEIYKLIQEHEFNAHDKVLDRIKSSVEKSRKLLDLSTAESSDIDLPDLPFDLYPFQKAGAKYMIESKRCFNGDDMGLGKTIQAITAMEATNSYPHIIICPAGVKKKWRREVSKWLPHRTSAILDDFNFSYNHDIMILNYEVVLKFLVREIPDPEHPKYLIREQIKRAGVKGLTCDESHYLKNPSSKRTKAVRALSKGIDYIWLLSGTIIENRPKELITQLQILRRLNDFGGYNYFIRRYCDAEMEWHGHMNKDGSSNLDELNKKLRQTCMVRRVKEDILHELPEKKPPRKIRVSIDNQEEYNLAKNDIFAWVEREKRKRRGNELNLNGDVDREVEKSKFMQRAIELQVINALKLITARGKLNKAVEWIEKFSKKNAGKLIVFANHIEIQQGLLKNFPSSARILGGMTPAEKTKNENLFQTNDNCKIIICSLKAANMGIDLFEGNHVLFVELGWTPSIHDQAEDRAHRIGQKNKVYPYYLLGNETIDEDIYELLQTKQEVVDASLNGKKDGYDTNILDELIERIKQKGEIKIPENVN